MIIPKHLAAQEVLFATLNSISDVKTFEMMEKERVFVNGVEFEIYCLVENEEEDGRVIEMGIGNEKEFEDLKYILKCVIDNCWDNKEGWEFMNEDFVNWEE